METIGKPDDQIKSYGFDTNDSEKSNLNDKIVKNKIFIRNLEWSVHENLLRHLLSKYGEIKRCKILRDPETKKSKGSGYVEFNDEIGPENVLKADPNDLALNGRRLFIDIFKKRNEPKFKSFDKSNKKVLNSKIEINELDSNEELFVSESLIEKLPYNVLCNIFSYLSIRDLCIAEQVCKRWYEIAKITWNQKQKLILNIQNIFENYTSKQDNPYGFVCRPDFGKKAMFQILSKNLKNLKVFDISEYYSKFGIYIGEILRMLAETCPNLTHLYLKNLSASNKSFTPLVKNCPDLKLIDISNTQMLSDASLSKIFQHCPQLEEFNFSNCREITGSCFERINFNNQNIQRVYLNDCDKIQDDYLILLLNRCRNIKNLSLKRYEPYLSETLLFIINNLSKLQSLFLSPTGFDCLKNHDLNKINFENLENLRELDIGSSHCDNKLLEILLKKLKSLRILCIDQCNYLIDDPFNISTIIAPLEEINLNFSRHIDSSCVQSLVKFLKSLKVLRLKGCTRFSREAVIKLIENLDKLTYLDVSLNNSVDNSVLETALWYEDRKIHINCNDSNIDTNKFMFDHPDTIREPRNRDSPIFKFKNLTFESLITPLKRTSDESPWRNDRMLYIGPPLESDEDEYDFDFDNDEQDYYQGDDLQDFLEEETEMYKEI